MIGANADSGAYCVKENTMKTVMIKIGVLAGMLSACAPTTEMTATPIALSGDLNQQARQVAEYNLIDPGSVTYRNT